MLLFCYCHLVFPSLRLTLPFFRVQTDDSNVTSFEVFLRQVSQSVSGNSLNMSVLSTQTQYESQIKLGNKVTCDSYTARPNKNHSLSKQVCVFHCSDNMFQLVKQWGQLNTSMCWMTRFFPSIHFSGLWIVKSLWIIFTHGLATGFNSNPRIFRMWLHAAVWSNHQYKILVRKKPNCEQK